MVKKKKNLMAEKKLEKLSGKMSLAAALKKKKQHSKKEYGKKSLPPPAVSRPKNPLEEAPGIPLKNISVVSNTKLFPPPPALLNKNNSLREQEDIMAAVADAVTLQELGRQEIERLENGGAMVPGNAATILDGHIPLPEKFSGASLLSVESTKKGSGVNPENETGAALFESVDLIRLTDDFIEEVENLVEVSNYFTDPSWVPNDIVDILHALVRTLNLDVMTLFLPSMVGGRDNIFHRGYEIPPTSKITSTWLSLFDRERGVDWTRLIDFAQSSETEIAYWIVHSNLHSIGYIPIRTGGIIYGFIFVASIGKKQQSPLTASLLDLCGSRIALEYKIKFILSNEKNMENENFK